MNPDELNSVATQFGVARAHVERDHLISHLLGYLSAHFADQIVFIGRTDLARTHLVDGRHSEDIDLVAVGSRSAVACNLDRALPRAVMRSHGRLEWAPAITEVPEHLGAVLRSQFPVIDKVQLQPAEVQNRVAKWSAGDSNSCMSIRSPSGRQCLAAFK